MSLLGLLLVLCASGCGIGEAPTMTPSPTITPTADATPVPDHTVTPSNRPEDPSPATSHGIAFTGIGVLSGYGARDELIHQIERSITDFYAERTRQGDPVVERMTFGDNVEYEPGTTCEGNQDGPRDHVYIATIRLNDLPDNRLRIETIDDGQRQELTRLFIDGDDDNRGILIFPTFTGQNALARAGVSADMMMDMQWAIAGFHQNQAWCDNGPVVSTFAFGSDVTHESSRDKVYTWHNYTVSMTLHDGPTKPLYFIVTVMNKDDVELLTEIGYSDPAGGDGTIIDSVGD